MKPQVRIVSGGNYVNTQIFVDGKPLNCVVEASWSCRTGELATATLTLDHVDVDVIGERRDEAAR